MKVFGIFLLLLAYFHNSAAVTVVTCEDSQGERTFQTTCPPGTTEVTKKDYNLSEPAPAATTAKPELVLYRIPECATCDQVREFLAAKSLPFTEVDISMDSLLQEKVKQLINDELKVPVLAVGETIITGYNRPAMMKALTDAGHITVTP